jgi:hypothetical protein
MLLQAWVSKFFGGGTPPQQPAFVVVVVVTVVAVVIWYWPPPSSLSYEHEGEKEAQEKGNPTAWAQMCLIAFFYCNSQP